jgi:hypothetical protein
MPRPVPALPAAYNVDYFSFPWNEFDLKSSWSVMTKRKKTHIDGIRLENASWRIFAMLLSLGDVSSPLPSPLFRQMDAAKVGFAAGGTGIIALEKG